MPESAWNALEVAKLATAALTPITIAGLGVFIHRLTKRYEHTQWKNQKLIEKRLEIYQSLASDLNDNLCYFTYIGSWKERTPPEIIMSKRSIDKKIYLAAPLFSPKFFITCMAFQDLCFETYNGWGSDARLRTRPDRRRQVPGKPWEGSWDEMFSTAPSHPSEIKNAYIEVMRQFSDEIGIHSAPTAISTGNIPGNIKIREKQEDKHRAPAHVE